MNIRISGIVNESIVDGPGVRYVVFAQGCLHKCEGCHNPDTHDLSGGYLMSSDYLAKDILKNKYLDGVTFSGGEPFLQAEAFAYAAKLLKEQRINIMCYTGNTFEQIINSKNPHFIDFLYNIDILVDGLFIKERMDRNLLFRGSTNQRIINVAKTLREKHVIEEFFYKSVS